MRKNSRGNNTHIRQNKLQKKGHKERLRRSLHNTQRKNPSRHINVVNIYAPKHIKKILEAFKKYTDSNTIIVGDFNTCLLYTSDAADEC